MARVLSSLLLVLAASPAAAEVLDSPRAQGMAGAMAADAMHNAAVLYNPAGMAGAYAYAAEVQYFRKGNPGGAEDDNAVALSVVDSKTQPAIAVGVAYGFEFNSENGDAERSGHNARLGFATAPVPNQLMMGVALHYLHLDRPKAQGDLKGFTLDAGMLFHASSMVHLGVVGHNLINLDDPEAPVMAGGGLALTGELFTLDVDTLMDFTTQDGAKPVFRVGGELFVARVVPLRAGFERNNATDENSVSGGLGFVTADDESAGTQVNLSYRQGLSDSKAYQFGVGMTIFL